MTAASLAPAARARLAASITRWTGFHPDAVSPRAVDGGIGPLLEAGVPVEDVIACAERDEPALRHRLTQAVPVGETFFFRIPEHFAFLREVLAPRWAAEPARTRAIWSAGCAAGEEAYSLAAVLRAAGVPDFQVVGTDLVEANVQAARAAQYGPWSLRGQMLAAEDPFLLAQAGAEAREVDPALRARTRFEVQNLLEAPPAPGRFDLIFCRNVLIYFAPDAASRAMRSLAAALAPGGVLAFATMDVSAAPATLVRVGPPELQLFQRPPAGESAALQPQPVAATPPAPACAVRPAPGARTPRTARSPAAPVAARSAPEPVALHLQALAHLDRGDHGRARALLADLQRLAPEYLPGMLEGALWHAREGRRGRAVALMHSVLERAQGLADDEPVAGPEILPASFYAAAARTFLGAEVSR